MGPLRGVARAAALFFAVVRGYDLEPDTVAHNLGCVQWAPPSGQGKGSPVEVGKGAQLCRTLGGAAAARSPQETAEWRLGTVAADGTCRGSKEFELGSSPPEARLFWHKQVRASSAAILRKTFKLTVRGCAEQNFNALPLPLMTWLGAARFGKEPEGVCRVKESGGWSVGVLFGGGADYAKCSLPDGRLLEGDFELLVSLPSSISLPPVSKVERWEQGGYNRSAPYLPMLRPGAAHRRSRADNLKLISQLLDTHISAADGASIANVTGTPLSELRQSLAGAQNVTLDRFLSADRFVHSELNAQGLHVLRCMLAERVVDARRVAANVTAHPDYASFKRDGYLIKDFSKLDNAGLADLLRMVSGYGDLAEAGLPSLDWTLRSVTASAATNDANTDLHVDSCMPSWKVWLYAEDIDASHGPLTYVRGSHHNSRAKMAWLQKISTDPPALGAGSYGSFRIGQYGRAWDERDQSVELRPPYVADEDGVWRCANCLDEDERDFGMPPRAGLVAPKLSLVIADVSGLHARGLAVAGAVRRTFILAGDDNDGGIKRSNPFREASDGFENAIF